METKALQTALQRCELFSTLNDGELEDLIKQGQLKQLPRGKILYLKGQKSDDTFCFILSGGVNIVAKDGHIVKELGQNIVVGEVALSNPYQTRTVTVITRDPTDILEWNVKQVKEKIPELWKKLLKLAWKDMSEYYEE